MAEIQNDRLQLCRVNFVCCCTQFKDKLESMRNYRPVFLDGTTNIRTSSFKEHADTDMHAHAMILFSLTVTPVPMLLLLGL